MTEADLFRAAMDAAEAEAVCHTKGENGADSLTAAGVKDPRVALFYRAVRGASHETLRELSDAVLAFADKAASGKERAGIVADLVVLAFQTRDIQEGKGERDLYLDLLMILDERLPNTVEASLPLLVTGFGSFRDLRQLVAKIDKALLSNGAQPHLTKLRAAALQLFVTALKADADALADSSVKESGDVGHCKKSRELSLAAKWAPREGGAHSRLGKELAELLFPGTSDARKLYRKLVAGLNAALGTAEVRMSSGEWDKIKPGGVPARCLNLKKGAFMNVIVRGKNKGAQRSEDPRRIRCAEVFSAHAKRAREDPSKARMHGANMQPHELVRHYLGRAASEDDIVEAQWVDLRESLKEAASREPGGAGLGNMIPLVDVSGSMSGTPMEVAIALGLLVAEMTHSAFRDRVLTFESNPQWHKLPSGKESLKSRVQSIARAPWGGSTNFQAAMNRVLATCVDANLSPELVGSLTLVAFSDMQFDEAEGSYSYYRRKSNKCQGCWETHYETLCNSFANAGLRSNHKKPYPVPRVVFWNLRGDTEDYPADAETPGVAMLSGFSASMLKLFLQADVETMVKEQEQLRLPPEHRNNAYDVLRKALDHKVYQSIRQVCANIGEGPLEGYEMDLHGDEDWEVVQGDLERAAITDDEEDKDQSLKKPRIQ